MFGERKPHKLSAQHLPWLGHRPGPHSSGGSEPLPPAPHVLPCATPFLHAAEKQKHLFRRPEPPQRNSLEEVTGCPPRGCKAQSLKKEGAVCPDGLLPWGAASVAMAALRWPRSGEPAYRMCKTWAQQRGPAAGCGRSRVWSPLEPGAFGGEYGVLES